MNDVLILYYSFKTKKMEIIGTILIGAAAGWLASIIYRGGSLGILWNIIVGILGGFLGYWLLGLIGVNLGTGWIGAILTGVIGAIVLLFLLNLIIGKKK